MSQLRLTVIAGPNGSGKSTLTDYLIENGATFGRYINADNIARDNFLSEESGAREAQRLAEQLREQCLVWRVDFSFETVMSHPSKIEFMRRAKAEGYQVTLFFVATCDPQLNIERVRARVALGGHDVPVDKIISRHARSISLLPEAMKVCDRTVVFDNSAVGIAGTKSALRPVLEAQTRDGGPLEMRVFKPCPFWVLEATRSLGVANKKRVPPTET